MTEAEEQKAIVKWFRATYPQYSACVRVSLSGLNFGSGQRAARMVNHVRSQGVIKGESDLAILLPRQGYGSLLLEHKAEGAAHTVTPEQQDYLDHHNAIGNCAVSTRGIEAAKAAIIAYIGE